MLPIVLVFLVATSALAAPGINISAASINEVIPERDSGRLVSSYVTNRAVEIVDGGDTNVYVLIVQQVLHDLANQPDRNSQALAMSQLIGMLGALATGIPGDACAASNLIDVYVSALQTNNYSGVPAALGDFIQSLISNIDLIVQLDNNPSSVRYAVGPFGNCNGGGRSYQFESAWDAVLSTASPSQADLINEQYCATKRLYNALNSRSNNVGAVITAASLPPVNSVFQYALGPVANFARSIGTGSSAAAAGAAKQALLHGLNEVSF